jgi:hypothetical protein
MDALYAFINQCCKEQQIDESHNLKHSISALRWAHILMDSFPDLTQDERQVISYAIALHDMCDSKYTDTKVAAIKIKEWLLTQTVSEEISDVIIKIIQTMSYSKLKKQMVESGSQTPIYPDHGQWQRAYHIVRHADLLDAYVVARCFLYSKHIDPDLQDEVAWSVVEKLFENRVFKYVSDGFIFYPKALELAAELTQDAKKTLKDRAFTY